MRIGLDVGGTHTDAVLVGDRGVIATAKVKTDHQNLLDSVLHALKDTLGDVDRTKIEGVALSTTLTTNALLEKKTDRVGVIVSSGPGIDPQQHRIGDEYFVIDGSIDHRGLEKKALNRNQLDHAVAACKKKGIDAYAVVSKFSTRNPSHELLMEGAMKGNFTLITAGHRLSGGLNFPRRITTAYFNSAVSRKYHEFARAVGHGVAELGISSPINVLKADGGTMLLSALEAAPVQSILSGPAASIMGIAALYSISRDAVLLDIGGTSTDIAVFAEGSPLLEQEGISLHGFPTLVRALKTISIALGGDSALRSTNGRLSVGPDRSGPCMAAGGSTPTLIDALNVTGESKFGDVEASRRGISALAQQAETTPAELSREAVEIAVGRIKEAVLLMIREINDKPVYTIHELLHTRRIVPGEVYIVGGPAEVLANRISSSLGVKAIVPRLHSFANALGAAVTRATRDLELFADTERRTLLVPRLSMQKPIQPNYSLDQARQDAADCLLSSLDPSENRGEETPVQIVEASSFNMIQGSRTIGRNIRVRCQIKPGYYASYLAAVRSS